MPSIVELVATITGRIDGFRKSMADGAQATEGFAKAWSKAGADVASATTRVGSAVGVMVGGIVGYTARLGVAFNASQESAKIMLTTLLGDGELAKRKLAEIQELSKSTPFSFAGIREGAIQFINAKVKADELIPRLRAVADAVSAVGGTDEQLKGVTMALSQMMTAGRLNAGDMLQLTGRGINAWDMLADHFKKTVGEIREMSEKGQIDGRQAADIIMRGMAEKFAGSSATLGKSMQGILSSLHDTIEENAGTIFIPLTNYLKSSLSFVSDSITSAGFQRWVGQMQKGVEGVINAIERFSQASGTTAIEGIGEAFIWAAKGTAELIDKLRTSMPWIQKTAQEWMRFLEPVGKWIKDNPGLVAGLVATGAAFKGLQLLGITQMFTSLISTIGPTIGLLTKIPGLFVAIKTAVMAASVPMMAFFITPPGLIILGALAAIAAAVGYVALKYREANLEADTLDKKFKDLQSQQRGKVLNYQGASDAETMSYLRTQREQAEKNRLGLEAQARGAAKPGSGEDARTKKQLAERAEEAKAFVAAIDARIAALSPATSPQQQQSQTAQAKPTFGQESLAPIAPITKKEQDRLDKEAAKEALRQRKDEAKRQDQADDKIGQFTEKLRDLQGVVPNQELVQFANAFQYLRKQFLEGQIDADQYRDGLKFLDNRMQDAAKVGDQQTGLAAHTQTAAEKLDKHEFEKGTKAGVSDAVLGTANKKFDAIEAAGQQVAAAFKNGQISATQYAQEMQRLKKATDDVTDASIKEEQQKRKEALMKGDFKGAGLDFNSAVQKKMEDKVIEQRMAMFDGAVDNIVNAFFPLANVVQTVSDGFTALDDGISKAADGIGNWMSGGGGGGGNDTQAQQNWINYLNSAQGKIDSFLNNISFYQQAMTEITNPDRLKEYADAIANLNRQIAAINNQVHTFTGYVSNDPIFRDPGITGGGNSPRSITINQHIPNVQNFSQSDMDHLANRLADTFSRMGNTAFR